MSAEHPRKPWLAAVLSFLSPGLGQLYNGSPRKALFFAVLSSLLIPLLVTTVVQYFWGLLLAASLSLCVFFTYLCDSIREAKRKRSYHLRAVNRWWIYTLYFLVVIAVQDVARDRLIYNVFQSFRIPSASMRPSLEIGDRFILARVDFPAMKLTRGDLVVYTPQDDPRTSEDESRFYVLKRIVGLPGETLEIKAGRVYINGFALDEDYRESSNTSADNFSSITLGDSCVFLLGDNREHSKDSRYYAEPCVPLNRIVGKALYLYWSSGRAGVRWERIGLRLDGRTN